MAVSRRRALFLSTLLLGGASLPAGAQETGLCGAFGPSLPPYSPLPPEAGVRLEADWLSGSPAERMHLEGDVRYQKGDLWLQSGRVDLFASPRRLDLHDGVNGRATGLLFQADSGTLYPDRDAGRFANFHYWVEEAHGYGSAREARQLDPLNYQLDGSTYSTCPREDQDWQLRASRVDLDREAGRGLAHHARLAFQGVPFLYSPYVTFPIDDRRQSGFLTPDYGSSSDRGTEFSIPYYWNIAPAMDATFTPHYMSDRGLMLGTQFRFLHRRGRGEINVDYLAEDDQTGDARHLLDLSHQGNWAPRWDTRLELRRASDKRYLDDFGDDIEQTTSDYLESIAEVRYRQNGWTTRLRAQDYQTVDPDIPERSYPYSLAPQLLVSGRERLPGGAELTTHAEWVDFRHDSDRRDTGDRFNIEPGITLPLEGSFYHFEPALRVSHTRYSLQRGEGETGPASIQRTVPWASLDTGLIFEKRQAPGDRFIKTLEPRIFYLYRPERDQADIPRFDAGHYNFSFAQLFRDRRYTGPDRLGDANQLTTALTWRWLDMASGREAIAASVGRIHYLEDYSVTLGNESPITAGPSNLITELRFRPSEQWRASLTSEYDSDEEKFEQGRARVRYRAGEAVANLGYYFRRDSVESTDVSFALPISQRWTVLARHNYSFRDERMIDSLLGLEYDSCCWAFHAAFRRYVNGSPGADELAEYSDSIYVQLTFKGLGNLGQGAAQLLEHDILGYRAQGPYRY